jgi:hypothetical protein
MRPVGFEPTIPVFERALDLVAPMIGSVLESELLIVLPLYTCDLVLLVIISRYLNAFVASRNNTIG